MTMEELFDNEEKERYNALFKRGTKWRHFKGHTYETLGVANHTERDEVLVLYRKVDEDGTVHKYIHARPIKMFLSPVDYDKYPNAMQNYRFEKIESNHGKNI